MSDIYIILVFEKSLHCTAFEQQFFKILQPVDSRIHILIIVILAIVITQCPKYVILVF